MRHTLLIILLTMFTCSSLNAKEVMPLYVGYADDSAHYGKYFGQLIEVALQKTQATYGPYVTARVSKKRTFHHLLYEFKWKDESLSIIWLPTTPEREKDFEAIPFNLLKGLNHYRFLLARKDRFNKFLPVRDKKDLINLVAGSGIHWSDTQVIKHNNLPVVTSISQHLEAMLQADRFDYLSRGAYEIGDEMAHYPEAIGIVPNLTLHYPTNYYFFVKKDNKVLAERIFAGLKIMEADGSLDKVFFSIPSFKYGWEQVHDNPNMRTIKLKPLHSNTEAKNK